MARVALVALALWLATAAAAHAAPERRLCVVQSGTAIVTPELDRTVYLPQRYSLKGQVDTLHRLEGLTVRLLGEWGDGQVVVPPPKVGDPSVVQAVAGAWRGRIPAEVLQVDPLRVRTAEGDLDVVLQAGERAALQPGSLLTLVATVQGRQAVDARVEAPLLAHARRGPVRLLTQVTEGFLNRALAGYRKSHPEQFTWKALTVRELGVTLLGCAPGRVRLYGAVVGATEVLGQKLPEVEGEFEIVATPVFQGAELEFQPVPDTLQLRMVRPLRVPVPPSWSGGLQTLLKDQQFRVPVPGPYWKDLVDSGVVRAEDLAKLEVLTLPTGDRATSLLVVAGPVQGVSDSGPDLLRNRVRSADGFAVALSDEAMDDVLRRNVPPLLPIRRDLPQEARITQNILFLRLVIDAVEISELQLDYRRGVVGIEALTANVHWSLGPFSGWEPGARLAGTAAVSSRPGPPLSMVIHPDVTRIEFLSSHIRDRSAEEQEELRKRVADGLRSIPLDVLLPSQMPVQGLGVLELLDFQALPEELVIQGHWMK